MISKTLDLTALLTILAIAAAVYAWLWRTRLRMEFRTRLAELLGLAARRERPLPPLFALAAREERGHRRRVAKAVQTRLDAGDALSDALRAGGTRWFPADYRSAVAAAEEVDSVPEVLDALSKQDLRRLSITGRVSFGVFYPAVLFAVLAGLHALITALQSNWMYVHIQARITPHLLFNSVFVVAFALIAVAVLGGALRRRGLLPGGASGALAHVLRMAGTLHAAGQDLGTALGRAAGTMRHRGVKRRARRAADLLQAPGSGASAWAALGLAPADAARLASGPAGRHATTLRHLADRLEARQTQGVRRLLAMAYPLAVLLVGVMVLLEFRFVMEVVIQSQTKAILW